MKNNNKSFLLAIALLALGSFAFTKEQKEENQKNASYMRGLLKQCNESIDKGIKDGSCSKAEEELLSFLHKAIEPHSYDPALKNSPNDFVFVNAACTGLTRAARKTLTESNLATSSYFRIGKAFFTLSPLESTAQIGDIEMAKYICSKGGPLTRENQFKMRLVASQAQTTICPDSNNSEACRRRYDYFIQWVMDGSSNQSSQKPTKIDMADGANTINIKNAEKITINMN